MRLTFAMLLLAIPAMRVFAEAPEAKTLKTAYPDFRIGAAIPGPKAFKAEEIALLTAQFNALTPGNCMKPGPVHPEEKKWNFETADALVAFAQEHQMQVFGHTLVWHNQTAAWMFQDAKDASKPATREVALAR